MAKATGWAEAADAMNERHPAPTAIDAEWADAIVFGTPTRFGSVSSELKAYIDSLGGLWVRGKLNGKAGAVYCSNSESHGGNESTLLSMYNPLAHLGFIIVPTGYADASLYKAGTPYGASTVSNNQATSPSADDLDVARFQGRRVAEVAKALTHFRVK
jgi:NAD(P)H dehydrogenase (quinone)